MTQKQKGYIPALGYHWLTFLYDPILRWTMRETTFKTQLVKQADIRPGQRVLDLGCGTATLTLLVKELYPKAEVIGLDGDPEVLQIAKNKAAEARLAIQLDQGLSYELPYPDNTFDRVLSSLLFQHLTRENKIRSLKEVFRVLKSGGELHIVDWGKPQNAVMRIAFLSIQLLDRFETTSDNADGLLPHMMLEAGFVHVQETVRFSTVYGTLSLYQARKPE